MHTYHIYISFSISALMGYTTTTLSQKVISHLHIFLIQAPRMLLRPTMDSIEGKLIRPDMHEEHITCLATNKKLTIRLWCMEL